MERTSKITLPAANSQDARVAYTIRETSKKLGVSTKSIRRMIYRGLLPTSKALRKILIPAQAVDNFMEVTQ